MNENQKTGELEGGTYIQIYSKVEYIAGELGRGLKWKEEPGVYLKNWEHKGDRRSEGEEIKKGDQFKEKVPMS